MLRNLEFDAPIKVISEANNRDHWRVKSQRRQAQQMEMAVYFKNALQGRKIALPCVVKLTRIGAKLLDDDNLRGSLKFCRDQIAKVIGIDDADSRIKFDYAQEAIGRHEYNVRVSITSV